MKNVLIFSVLLLVGLVGSQVLPPVVGPSYATLGDVVRMLTMVGLSFIMIRVGYEFDLDKRHLAQYGWDYVVAFTAASIPWILVTLYFVFVLLPSSAWRLPEAWQETLLAGRFAAPTSAGVLFSMLAAAGLGATWLYRKARILAIFDDLDTVLLMIPLKMLMIGLAWQLGLVVLVMVLAIVAAYVWLHRVRLPATWPWVMTYAVVITGMSELLYQTSKVIDESVPIHIEVLLPAFALGCVLAYPSRAGSPAGDPHHLIEAAGERRVATIVAATFMVLVGLSMPMIAGADVTERPRATAEFVEADRHAAGVPAAEARAAEAGAAAAIGRITAGQPAMSWSQVLLHVYRRNAHWRERLALAIGMWPRGEVGAGVLVISLSYGIGGPVVTIAMLSLALNLLLTGVFILIVKRLTRSLPAYAGLS